MRNSGLADPPRTPAPPSPAPPAPAVAPSARPRRSTDSDSYDRALRWALGASLVVHALVLLLSPVAIRVGAPPGDGPLAELARPDRALRVIQPRVAGDAAEEPSTTTAPPAAAVAAPRAIIPVPGRRDAAPREAPSAGAPVDRAAAAAAAREALRPGYRDSRLWVAPDPLRVEEQLSNHERYMEHLEGRVAAINDSIAGTGPNTDWTTKDEKGRRWGLSPDGLHLGGITVPRELIPIPRATGDNASLEAAREKQRQREEIQRQEDRRARERAREEAAKATRARKEAEKKGGGGGGA